jgi:hypothetical protein
MDLCHLVPCPDCAGAGLVGLHRVQLTCAPDAPASIRARRLRPVSKSGVGRLGVEVARGPFTESSLIRNPAGTAAALVLCEPGWTGLTARLGLKMPMKPSELGDVSCCWYGELNGKAGESWFCRNGSPRCGIRLGKISGPSTALQGSNHSDLCRLKRRGGMAAGDLYSGCRWRYRPPSNRFGRALPDQGRRQKAVHRSRQASGRQQRASGKQTQW